MASRLTHSLVAAACLFNGLMAGGNFIRLFVEMPAWRQVGPLAWAAFSRHADLGAGLVIYPVVAIGGALLMLAAAIVFHFDRGAPRSAALPIYLSLALVIGGLAITRLAAPYMLSLRTTGDDPAALSAAFEGFDRWGTIRGVMQMLAFPVNLWGVVAVLRIS